MRKIFNIISFLTLAITMALVILVAYWILYPYNPMVIPQGSTTITPSQVKAGDVVYLHMSYCKFMNLPATVNKQFIDEIIYSMPAITVNNPPGCHTVVVPIEVPKGLTPDEYTLEQSFTYQVNPIRTIVIKSKSNTFEVIK